MQQGNFNKSFKNIQIYSRLLQYIIIIVVYLLNFYLILCLAFQFIRWFCSSQFHETVKGFVKLLIISSLLSRLLKINLHFPIPSFRSYSFCLSLTPSLLLSLSISFSDSHMFTVSQLTCTFFTLFLYPTFLFTFLLQNHICANSYFSSLLSFPHSFSIFFFKDLYFFYSLFLAFFLSLVFSF